MNQKNIAKLSVRSPKNGPLTQIPDEERPYEKCLALGPEALSDAELLAVILRTGVPGESVVEISRKLLHMQGNHHGLLALHHASLEEITSIRGVGIVKAIQMKCVAELSLRFAREQASETLCFSSASSIASYYMERMRHYEQEHMLLLMLDTKCRLIREEVISKGTVHLTVISPREIFICALRSRAVGIVLLHNHPSGACEPSREDLELTRRVQAAGAVIGISLLDHIIIGDRSYFSMLEKGLLLSEE